MRTHRTFAATRPGQPSLGHAAPAPSSASATTKLLLIDFRSGEAVAQHPDLRTFLKEGWRVKSAVPRLVETGGTKLFVVLTQDPLPLHENAA